MKNIFSGFLILNFLLEGLAAITLIGGTLGIFSIAQLEAGPWAMNYGFGAAAIATAVFWVWPYRDSRQAVSPVLGILLAFFLYIQRSKWCGE